MDILEKIPRYCVCVRTTRRPIFEFIDSGIHPNDALQVFALPDDYSFGVLQSNVHWDWFCARCSTLKSDWRYTSNTVYDTFPWPQEVKIANVRAVASAAVALRQVRTEEMQRNNWSLRELYRAMEESANNPVSAAQEELDREAREAFGMRRRDDDLEFIFKLNKCCWDAEESGKAIQGPGLPSCVKNRGEFISKDAVTMGRSD